MTSQTVAWFSHGSPISEQHCLWTLLKQASTKVEIIPQEKWFSEAMFQWPSLDACPEVQHWYVGTVPRRTVQPIAVSNSRLGSNCIQGSLHHTAIEDLDPADVQSHRPISNLSVLSKLLELTAIQACDTTFETTCKTSSAVTSRLLTQGLSF